MHARPTDVVRRQIQPVILRRMGDEPVILVEGARTVGKSTLLRELATATGARLLDLDDLSTREAVEADPMVFLGGPSPVFVDEYQHVPTVLDAIKSELNKSSRPGRFILTGSARHDSLPAAAQALTGRLHRVPIHPLSQTEIEGSTGNLLADLIHDPTAVVGLPTSSTTREDYIERVITGGFPISLNRQSQTARHRWFDDYIRLTLERDVRELSRIRQAVALPRVLERLAGQTAQILNVANIGSATKLNERTTDGYIRLLETVFLVFRLPAWGTTLISRTSSRPKLHMVDSGLAARLLRLSPDKLAQRSPSALTELGHLLETFVVGEILKQASWLDNIGATGHWRTRDGDEVDLVVELDDGTILGFEIKASLRVTGKDFKPLRKLRESTGDAFRAGYILHLGERSYTADDRLHVLPIDRLWTT